MRKQYFILLVIFLIIFFKSVKYNLKRFEKDCEKNSNISLIPIQTCLNIVFAKNKLALTTIRQVS